MIFQIRNIIRIIIQAIIQRHREVKDFILSPTAGTEYWDVNPGSLVQELGFSQTMRLRTYGQLISNPF